MILTKIYYKDELILHEKVNYIKYIKINNINDINFNDTKYLNIIIGWNLVNNIEKINILNKKINKSFLWEFSFNERKAEYIKLFNNIEQLTTDFHIKKFSTKNVNLKQIVNIINDKSLIFVNNNNVLYTFIENQLYVNNLKEEKFFNENKYNFYFKEIKEKVGKFYHDNTLKFFKKIQKKYHSFDNEQIKLLLPYFFHVIYYNK